MENNNGKFTSHPARKARRRRGGRYAAKPAPRRRQRQRNARPAKLWLLLLPVVAVALLVGLALRKMDQQSTYTFQDSGIQHYAGTSAPVLRGSQLKFLEDGSVEILQNGQRAPTSLPVYLDNSREIVATSDMLYYAPRNNYCQRLMHFSHVLCRDNGMILVSRGEDEIHTESGFLYDGGDLYVFLEPMKVSFNGYSVELPALSYVEAVYGGHISLFNYETKESIVEVSNGTGIAQTVTGGYTISLMGDSLEREDGSKRLLIVKPDLMDPIA